MPKISQEFRDALQIAKRGPASDDVFEVKLTFSGDIFEKVSLFVLDDSARGVYLASAQTIEQLAEMPNVEKIEKMRSGGQLLTELNQALAQDRRMLEAAGYTGWTLDRLCRPHADLRPATGRDRRSPA